MFTIYHYVILQSLT